MDSHQKFQTRKGRSISHTDFVITFILTTVKSSFLLSVLGLKNVH